MASGAKQAALFPYARVTILCAFGLFAAYLAVFALTVADATVFDLVYWSLANGMPPVMLGWLVAMLLVPALPKPRLVLTVALAVSGLGYALAIYLITTMLLALQRGFSEEGLFLQFFRGPAFFWQVFQGLAYYAIALLAGYLRLYRERAAQLAAVPASPAAKIDQMLLRTDAGIVTVAVEDILHIVAADDYCEIVLSNNRHLARIGMTECEKRLAGHGFLRIHRSHIVNLGQMVSAEPAGNGRLQILMPNGDRILTSRAGTQALRGRTV